MAFFIEAFIGVKPILARLAEKLPSAEVLELTNEFGIIPLTKKVKAAAGGGSSPFTGLELSGPLAEAAEKASGGGALGYIEARYTYSLNHQGSIVWAEGRRLLGPLVDDTPWDPRENNEDRPGNKMLRTLGLKHGDFADEWDAAALTRNSDTERWIK